MSLKRFMSDENGATMVEYGLLTALISMVMLGSLNALGQHIKNTFTAISDQMVDGSN